MQYNKPKANQKAIEYLSSKKLFKTLFFTFTNEMLLSLFADKGLDFIVEDNDRVFPESEKSGDILDILTDYLEDVVITYNFEVTKITQGFVINDRIKADKIIIATGGITYPQTGCDFKNYSLTSQPLTSIKYGLVPLITKKTYLTLPVLHCSM